MRRSWLLRTSGRRRRPNSTPTLRSPPVKSLEQSVTAQRNADAETARKTPATHAADRGRVGPAPGHHGAHVLSWRAFTKITRSCESKRCFHERRRGASARRAGPGSCGDLHPAHKVDVWSNWNERSLTWKTAAIYSRRQAPSPDLLVEGQALLDAGQPQKALEFFDRLLTSHPDHAETQKIGRWKNWAGCRRRWKFATDRAGRYIHAGISAKGVEQAQPAR